MTALPLILAGLLGAVILAGYVAVLVGMRREDRTMHLPQTAPGRLPAFARWVTGCHIQQNAPSVEENGLCRARR